MMLAEIETELTTSVDALPPNFRADSAVSPLTHLTLGNGLKEQHELCLVVYVGIILVGLWYYTGRIISREYHAMPTSIVWEAIRVSFAHFHQGKLQVIHPFIRRPFSQQLASIGH